MIKHYLKMAMRHMMKHTNLHTLTSLINQSIAEQATYRIILKKKNRAGGNDLIFKEIRKHKKQDETLYVVCFLVF